MLNVGQTKWNTAQTIFEDIKCYQLHNGKCKFSVFRRRCRVSMQQRNEQTNNEKSEALANRSFQEMKPIDVKVLKCLCYAKEETAAATEERENKVKRSIKSNFYIFFLFLMNFLWLFAMSFWTKLVALFDKSF